MIGSDWTEDLFANDLLVLPDRCFSGVPTSRQYTEFALPRDAEFPHKMQTEILFAALGWWPFPDRPAPKVAGRDPCVLPDVAESPEYVVSTFQEQRHGEWCHVLERPGRDRLWIADDKNCALVGREFYDGDTGATMQRIDLTGHRELSDGVWAPTEIRRVLFDFRADSPEARLRPVLDSRIRIVDVAVNEQVDPRLFDWELPPPGTLRVREGGTYTQVVPGGFEYMDELTERIRRAGYFPSSSEASNGLSDLSVIGIGAGIFLFIQTVSAMHRRRPGGLSTAGPAHARQGAGRGNNPD